ncbi:MAG: carboxylesterase/lipase family protein [Ilumatobacteraceae bacterium]
MKPSVQTVRNIVYARAARFDRPETVDIFEQLPSAVQCPQVPGFLETAMGTTQLPMSEDCLTLNVHHPIDSSLRLPVLVWIHGGAFTNGTANAAWYDGSNLAARGCVVVCLNYRLGAFGFSGARDLGLQDQISALSWVRDNIHRFGGDPSNVTIFGESAGGCSVLALFGAPDARHLFHKGWAMSPSLGQLRTPERATQSEWLLAKELGVSSIIEVRPLDTSAVLQAQDRLLQDPKDVVTMFSPTVGGDVVASDAYDLIASDQRPLVIGTLRDENRLWVALNPASANLTTDDVKSEFARRFGANMDAAWRTYERLRPESTPAQLLAAMQSDESFRVPAWRIIDGRARMGAPTWSYFFTWPTPVFEGVLGACHGLDIPFTFDNIDAPNVEHFIGASPTHRHLVTSLADTLVLFARSSQCTWSPTGATRTTMQIHEENLLLVDPERDIYDLWIR